MGFFSSSSDKSSSNPGQPAAGGTLPRLAEAKAKLEAREVPKRGFCWNCRKPLHARSETCAFCGERQ